MGIIDDEQYQNFKKSYTMGLFRKRKDGMDKLVCPYLIGQGHKLISPPSFVKKDKERTQLVIVPYRKEISKGSLLAILNQDGLTK